MPFIAPNQALEATGAAATGLVFYGGIGSQIVVYGAIVYLLLRQAEQVIRWLGAMQWALALAAMAVLSTFWSQFSMYTVRRSIPFAIAGVFGLYLAMRFPIWRQLRILRFTLLTLAVATAVTAIAMPAVGLDISAGHHADWRGLFTQKNACGRMMVLGTVVSFSTWRFSWKQVAVVTVFLGVLVMSGSRSAWLVEGLCIVLWGMLCLMKRVDAGTRVLIAGSGFVAVPIMACIGVLFLPALSSWVGRDATLSGRTEIWKQVWIFVQQRLWLGWGYEGFWRGIQGEAFHVAAALHFVTLHAHNGFLEIWLELGLAGLALFALSYLRGWQRLWPILLSGDVDRVMWMVFILALILFYDLDENTLLTYNGLFWVLYVAALANIEFLAVEDALDGKLSYYQTECFAERRVNAASAALSQ